MLQACAETPVTPPAIDSPAAAAPPVAESGEQAVATSQPVAELKLNLPQKPSCPCNVKPTADHTFLEKGYRALLEGDYEEAMDNFQRFQRLEASSSVVADEEARIAIAYVRILPESPFYNPKKARRAYLGLRQYTGDAAKMHDYTRLMRQSLANMLEMQDRLGALEASNSTLQEDLKKREEALKRLRDLTLNQKATAQ